MNDKIAREASSCEASSADFWPNFEGEGGPACCNYAYPAPARSAHPKVRPAQARFNQSLGEFIVSYSAVAESDGPDRALPEFLQSTYGAAADLAGWNRFMLDHVRSVLDRRVEDS